MLLESPKNLITLGTVWCGHGYKMAKFVYDRSHKTYCFQQD